MAYGLIQKKSYEFCAKWFTWLRYRSNEDYKSFSVYETSKQQTKIYFLFYSEKVNHAKLNITNLTMVC